jgi:hypothetical protein
LPDGIFAYQKSQFGHILEGLGIKNVGTFYCNFEYCTSIWYIYYYVGVYFDHFVYFPPILVYLTDKNLAALFWSQSEWLTVAAAAFDIPKWVDFWRNVETGKYLRP